MSIWMEKGFTAQRSKYTTPQLRKEEFQHLLLASFLLESVIKRYLSMRYIDYL